MCVNVFYVYMVILSLFNEESFGKGGGDNVDLVRQTGNGKP